MAVSCRLSVNELRANLCLRRNMEKIVETVGGAADSIKDELDETRENVLNRLPSAEQFKMFIDKLQSMTDEEKEELKQNLIERAANEENLRKLYQNKHVVESSLLDIVIVLGFYGMVLVVVAVFGETFVISKIHLFGSHLKMVFLLFALSVELNLLGSSTSPEFP